MLCSGQLVSLGPIASSGRCRRRLRNNWWRRAASTDQGDRHRPSRCHDNGSKSQPEPQPLSGAFLISEGHLFARSPSEVRGDRLTTPGFRVGLSRAPAALGIGWMSRPRSWILDRGRPGGPGALRHGAGRQQVERQQGRRASSDRPASSVHHAAPVARASAFATARSPRPSSTRKPPPTRDSAWRRRPSWLGSRLSSPHDRDPREAAPTSSGSCSSTLRGPAREAGGASSSSAQTVRGRVPAPQVVPMGPVARQR